MFIRKIGKLLRGKATPFQIISATLLGGLLGGLPGFSQGPLLLAALLFLVIILNANLFLAGLTLILVKVISLLLLPLYFNLGVALLESGLGQVIALAVNAPVTAWFGFDYYVMIPSLVAGAAIGLVLGIGMSRMLFGFRTKMADLETGSERYEAYTSKWWVKMLAWLFVGGLKGKKSWTDLKDQGGGLPVRPLGVVFVLSLAVLGFVALNLLDTTIVTTMVREKLEQTNGATVDIVSIEILPAENRVILSGLEVTDPESLDTNRFASTEIVADISGMNLLSKKVVIDSLQILQPSTGTPRRVPGRIIVPIQEDEPMATEEDEISLDDYMGEASVWHERLKLLRRLYDRIAPHMNREEVDSEEISTLSWREQLALRAKEEGYAKINSASMVRESPTLWIRELKSDNLTVGGSSDAYALSGSNLSTQPALLEESGSVSLARMDGQLEVLLELPNLMNPNRTGVKVDFRDLAIDDLAEQAGRQLPMQGGSLNFSGAGFIDDGIIDLPIKVTLFDTTLDAFGTAFPLDNFPLEVGIGGTIDRPKLSIPKDAIENALMKGGQQQLENMIQEKAGDKLKGLFDF
jgi:uncharacterized protein (TIGR03546 family)